MNAQRVRHAHHGAGFHEPVRVVANPARLPTNRTRIRALWAWRHWGRLAMTAFFAAFLPGGIGHAATPEIAEEAQVKAAFLHKFPGFVQWPQGALPATANEPFIIGVAGADAVFVHLVQVV